MPGTTLGSTDSVEVEADRVVRDAGVRGLVRHGSPARQSCDDSDGQQRRRAVSRGVGKERDGWRRPERVLNTKLPMMPLNVPVCTAP